MWTDDQRFGTDGFPSVVVTKQKELERESE